MSGTAVVEFKYQDKILEVEKLISGSLLGCSELLNITSYNYYGTIKAFTPVTLLKIDRPDQVLELYERLLLGELFKD